MKNQSAALLTVKGLTVREFARSHNLPAALIYERLKRRWPEDAMDMPAGSKRPEAEKAPLAVVRTAPRALKVNPPAPLPPRNFDTRLAQLKALLAEIVKDDGLSSLKFGGGLEGEPQGLELACNRSVKTEL